jgi:hypothetical protein
LRCEPVGQRPEHRPAPAIKDGKESNEQRRETRSNTCIRPDWFCNRDCHEPGKAANEITDPEAIECTASQHGITVAFGCSGRAGTRRWRIPVGRFPPGPGKPEWEGKQDDKDDKSYPEYPERCHDSHRRDKVTGDICREKGREAEAKQGETDCNAPFVREPAGSDGNRHAICDSDTDPSDHTIDEK